MSPEYEVADVLNFLGKKIEHIGLNSWQVRTLSAIKKCRTSQLGGHIDACDSCGNISISYNSCRNRHCPKCQGSKRESWIQARETELLPVPYFHVVFTLPDSINSLAIHNPKLVYSTLFQAAWETLFAFGKNKGLQMGMIAILHTWGQNLSLHPHLHCIVPGGGIDKNGDWQNIRVDGKFLFSVKALSKVFRAKYCAILREKDYSQYENIRSNLWEKPWIVYAKRPFGNVNSVVEYLGRYTHKIAISNHRIKEITPQNVTFTYKDYKENGIKKQMTLSHEEFIRRFSLHILPKRFTSSVRLSGSGVKIRHYGFLSSTWKREKLKTLQQKLGVKILEKGIKSIPIIKCNCCKVGNLNTISTFDKRGPPAWYLRMSQKDVPQKS
jgi:hypothetical protein